MLYCTFSDMQEKAVEGPAASKEEADKLWLFTQQLIDSVHSKRESGDASINQSVPPNDDTSVEDKKDK